jgi:hypothetical protein
MVIRGLESLAVASRPLQRRFTQRELLRARTEHGIVLKERQWWVEAC